MRVSATAKYLRGSTRKARLVTQVDPGQAGGGGRRPPPVHAAARRRDVAKVLQSAAANAENNHNLSADDLVVVEAHANEGPTIKRWRPRAQGRAFPIHKPMTHITVVVGDQEV